MRMGSTTDGSTWCALQRSAWCKMGLIAFEEPASGSSCVKGCKQLSPSGWHRARQRGARGRCEKRKHTSFDGRIETERQGKKEELLALQLDI